MVVSIAAAVAVREEVEKKYQVATDPAVEAARAEEAAAKAKSKRFKDAIGRGCNIFVIYSR